MKELRALEEAIRIDGLQFIKNMKEILNQIEHGTINEEQFKICQKHWIKSEELIHKIRKLDYEENSLIPLVKKRLGQMLIESEKQIKLL